MANFLQPFLGNRPKIDDNKYTNIRQPWSRPKTKPIKRAQPLPSGPDEDEVDFLIYTKKAKLSSLDEQYKQYGHIGDAYEHCGPYENWTGSQWDPQPPDPRRIRGNGDAATLLNEFNETIDYARDLDRYINDVETSHGSLPKRLTDTFGPDTFSSMSHKELVDAIVPLVQLLFKERFRAFNAGINDDHSMRWRSTNDHEIAKAQRNVISRRIHRPRLEKDILLIRATSVPYPGNDFRRHMREYYEGIFKLRVGEASNIIRKAMETDSTLPTLSDDKRTHEAKRYTWIIRVINHYIGWRLGVTFNLKRALREPGEAREHLSRLDRMTWTDSYYEAFLDASMALLNDMQALGAWQAATSRLWAAMKTHAIGAHERPRGRLLKLRPYHHRTSRAAPAGHAIYTPQGAGRKLPDCREDAISIIQV
ncbi:hypothetical protein F4809DRAFT_630643 [Biscogniauxia mediterranea]|nr:hypothetical protein F4809DRAFT_630643 [Biscogniauxia mediterranea]